MLDPQACADRPYQAEAGPGKSRAFIFSPEVGRRIAGPLMAAAVTQEEIAAVNEFGRGTLEFGDYGLEESEGGCPIIQWLTFPVQIEGGYDHCWWRR